MISRKFLTGLLGGISVSLLISGANAAPITIPAGLNPGDQYRLAFVTSTFRDATSSDIADYNAFVTAAANTQTELAALGTTWMAIASTASVDARDNTGTNPGSSTGFPIYLLDPASTKIADNNADLWDWSLDARLNRDETGSQGSSVVWTGTRRDGVANGSRAVGTPGSGVGRPNLMDHRWIQFDNASYSWAYADTFSMYAISGVLTVTAVPEPGALGVLVLGLVGLAGMRRKRAV